MPYTAFHGHLKFTTPLALLWLGCLGGAGDTLSPRAWWEMDVRGSGRLVLEFGGKLVYLSARGSNLELGVEAKKTPAVWRLQAGNGRSSRSSCQVDQGHLQSKVSSCFFLP